MEGVDMDRAHREGAVVCLGDSTTDGTGSSVDPNNTWPDVLTRRQNDRPHIPKSSLNAGIGSNRILHDSLLALV
jgi:lysophospholipase L1-like esterase